jgi:hypothetical protein
MERLQHADMSVHHEVATFRYADQDAARGLSFHASGIAGR